MLLNQMNLRPKESDLYLSAKKYILVPILIMPLKAKRQANGQNNFYGLGGENGIELCLDLE